VLSYRGAGTASYQIEGAVTQDGRESSIWDIFSHTPNKTANGQTGDVADNSYNLYPADIQLMKAMDLPAFRFSLSWSRIIHADGSINQAGIDHYNAVIDSLLAADIEPYVTLYHWDLPTAYSSYVLGAGGDWLNSSYIVPRFVHYADVVFGAFGDRVKWWLTFNEPLTFCFLSYQVRLQRGHSVHVWLASDQLFHVGADGQQSGTISKRQCEVVHTAHCKHNRQSTSTGEAAGGELTEVQGVDVSVEDVSSVVMQR